MRSSITRPFYNEVEHNSLVLNLIKHFSWLESRDQSCQLYILSVGRFTAPGACHRNPTNQIKVRLWYGTFDGVQVEEDFPHHNHHVDDCQEEHGDLEWGAVHQLLQLSLPTGNRNNGMSGKYISSMKDVWIDTLVYWVNRGMMFLSMLLIVLF